jgi:hypothetical protein
VCKQLLKISFMRCRKIRNFGLEKLLLHMKLYVVGR